MTLLDGRNLIASYYTLSGSPVFEPSRHPFADRVAAASGAGFTGIGLTPDDVDATLAGGMSRADLRAILAEAGVSVRELEGLGGWHHVRGEGERASRREEERLYALADTFGPSRLHVALIGDEAMPPHDVVVERFAALCDRAAGHGLLVALEPLVIGPMQTLGEAAAVVAAADRPNAGVLIDTYHVFRGPETIDQALGRITPEQVVGVQINDAFAEPRGALFDDCCAYRLVPGEGQSPLVDMLVALDRFGIDLPLAVELMCDDIRPLPVDQAAERVASATRAVLAAAREATA